MISRGVPPPVLTANTLLLWYPSNAASAAAVNRTWAPSGDSVAPASATVFDVMAAACPPSASISQSSPRSLEPNSGFGNRWWTMRRPSRAISNVPTEKSPPVSRLTCPAGGPLAPPADDAAADGTSTRQRWTCLKSSSKA